VTRIRRLLFVTWDGPQTSYLETLFLPIFAGLKKHGIHTDVLQFRWGTAEQEHQIRAACERSESNYQAVEISGPGSPSRAFTSALAGTRHVRSAAARFGSDIIMPRSIMPALPVLLAGLRRPILFDADGLAADEKVEFSGLSANGMPYKVLRSIERAVLRRAKVTITRTAIAAHILSERGSISRERIRVVANGRDSNAFQVLTKERRDRIRIGIGLNPDDPLLVYAGSVGPQYRFDLMSALVEKAALTRPGTRLLLLTGQPEEAAAALSPAARAVAIIKTARPPEVPALLGAADFGLAFRQMSYSMRAVAPIKIAEYLLCGLPVIGTEGTGDSLALKQAGVFCDPADEAIDLWLEERTRDNERYRNAARQVGVDRYSLERSVGDYMQAIDLVFSLSADQHD
jgi:glycosyltransferase involved in cell wall biosynthesis